MRLRRRLLSDDDDARVRSAKQTKNAYEAYNDDDDKTAELYAQAGTMLTKQASARVRSAQNDDGDEQLICIYIDDDALHCRILCTGWAA